MRDVQGAAELIVASAGSEATCDTCGRVGIVGDPIRWEVNLSTGDVRAFCWTIEDGYCD